MVCSDFLRKMSHDGAFVVLILSSCALLLLVGMRLEFSNPQSKPGASYTRRLQEKWTTNASEVAIHIQHPMTEQSLIEIEVRSLPSKLSVGKNDKYFLYGEVLDKEHSFNRSNLIYFKKQFLDEPGRKFNTFIADQNNTNVGSKVPFYISKGKSYFNVTEEFYDRLPKMVNLSNLKTCTVVGNSGILRNSSCGRNIDGSDFIFRCNAAPLSPFARDAGVKSNITTFNPSIFNIRYGGIKKDEQIRRFVTDMEEYNGYLLYSCFGFKASMPLCLKALKKYNSSENVFTMGLPDFFTDISRVWSKRGLKVRLSTGFYLTMAALHFCEEVHLYGFWPFSVTSSSDVAPAVPYHYYDGIDFPSNSKNNPHSMDKEFSVLLHLHALGILRMHVATCS